MRHDQLLYMVDKGGMPKINFFRNTAKRYLLYKNIEYRNVPIYTTVVLCLLQTIHEALRHLINTNELESNILLYQEALRHLLRNKIEAFLYIACKENTQSIIVFI